MYMRLYDLAEQYNDLIDMLEGSDNTEALQAMLDGIESEFDAKVESIIKLIRSKIVEHNAVKAEADRLQSRAAKMAKEIDWLENYVETQMIATGKEKVSSPLFDIKIVNCPPAVNVLNESVIPEIFFVTKPAMTTLDKRSLLEALKAGSVPGAEIIQRKTLRVR